MTKLTGGEALVRALLPERIPFVFGLVGGKLAPFLRAVSLQPSMRFIGARHEGHAAMMASAVAAGSGQLGVVAAECGSGGGNLVPGIAMAKANNLPMFVLTSNNQHYASYPARGMFADMDTESLFRPITKWNTAVHDGRRIPELVRWDCERHSRAAPARCTSTCPRTSCAAPSTTMNPNSATRRRAIE